MKFKVKTSKREEIVDITSQVLKILPDIVDEYSHLCLIYVPHTTCAVMVNEGYDKNVSDDVLSYLGGVPREGWKHGEGNSDAHIKSALIGVSKVIPVSNCRLMLGKWQRIFLCEFDGGREREVVVEVA